MTLLNALGVLGVLNVLDVLYVLNMPMHASLACWALFLDISMLAITEKIENILSVP